MFRSNVARIALVAAVMAALLGVSLAGAHGGHPQKKLFNGQWYHTTAGGYGAYMNLTTSQYWYLCDGGTPSCQSKWGAPAQEAINDWNNQPTTVDFMLMPDQNLNYDMQVAIADQLFSDPSILGIALFYDIGANPCDPNSCTYYHGEAWQADDGHAGPYWGTSSQRRGTIIHELGHLLNLGHESISPDGLTVIECGFDETGAIPHSVMAYDCIFPLVAGGSAEHYVHIWDTCGVNHKYFDPGFGFSGCDGDGDLIPEESDNCLLVYNPAQTDGDSDGRGDACDNCPSVSNASQTNSDGDAFGNACDNCPTVTNASQTNSDGDSFGDACDNCPAVTNVSQTNSDGDSHGDACDNCPLVSSANQANFDGDAMGDVCDPDDDNDGNPDGSDPDDDNDRVTDVDEAPCGGATPSSLRPERVDGAFAGVDDDGDTVIDEALPGGAANNDCDGDGFKGSAESNVYAGAGPRDQDPCGNTGWPADFAQDLQPNALDVEDLGTYIAPVRHLNTSFGDVDYDVRWDLAPGSMFGEAINVQDMGALVSGASGYPPMLFGTPAYGSVCPWAP